MPQKKRMKDEVIDRYIDSLKVDEDRERDGKVRKAVEKWWLENEETWQDIDGICQNCSRDETDIAGLRIFWEWKTIVCMRCKTKW
jgi:hypothetical protein